MAGKRYFSKMGQYTGLAHPLTRFLTHIESNQYSIKVDRAESLAILQDLMYLDETRLSGEGISFVTAPHSLWRGERGGYEYNAYIWKDNGNGYSWSGYVYDSYPLNENGYDPYNPAAIPPYGTGGPYVNIEAQEEASIRSVIVGVDGNEVQKESDYSNAYSIIVEEPEEIIALRTTVDLLTDDNPDYVYYDIILILSIQGDATELDYSIAEKGIANTVGGIAAEDSFSGRISGGIQTSPAEDGVPQNITYTYRDNQSLYVLVPAYVLQKQKGKVTFDIIVRIKENDTNETWKSLAFVPVYPEKGADTTQWDSYNPIVVYIKNIKVLNPGDNPPTNPDYPSDDDEEIIILVNPPPFPFEPDAPEEPTPEEPTPEKPIPEEPIPEEPTPEEPTPEEPTPEEPEPPTPPEPPEEPDPPEEPEPPTPPEPPEEPEPPEDPPPEEPEIPEGDPVSTGVWCWLIWWKVFWKPLIEDTNEDPGNDNYWILWFNIFWWWFVCHLDKIFVDPRDPEDEEDEENPEVPEDETIYIIFIFFIWILIIWIYIIWWFVYYVIYILDNPLFPPGYDPPFPPGYEPPISLPDYYEDYEVPDPGVYGPFPEDYTSGQGVTASLKFISPNSSDQGIERLNMSSETDPSYIAQVTVTMRGFLYQELAIDLAWGGDAVYEEDYRYNDVLFSNESLDTGQVVKGEVRTTALDSALNLPDIITESDINGLIASDGEEFIEKIGAPSMGTRITFPRNFFFSEEEIETFTGYVDAETWNSFNREERTVNVNIPITINDPESDA